MSTEDRRDVIECTENSSISVNGSLPLGLSTSEFYDPKDLEKFVKNVERMVRYSIEYKEWRKCLRENLGCDHCFLTNERAEQVTVDLHHHPYTLYDIVEIVLQSRLVKGKPFTTYLIAQLVMELHYQNRVGIVPIVTTLHEKYDNGFLTIPMNLVFGNWKELEEVYDVPEDIRHRISAKINVDGKTEISWANERYVSINDVEENIEDV